MTVTININNLTLCHRGSNGVTHNTLPDICKTPDKAIPRPFDNEAYSKDLANGTTTVFADKGNMIANFGSIFSKSYLDGGGSLGGIKSGTFLAEADFITHSFDVFFEGKPACRLTDKMWMNHRNTVNMAGLDQINLTLKEKLCPAICYCSNRFRAAVAAGTATFSPDYWADAIVKQGGVASDVNMKTRNQQECVARQFSSGWPIYEPKEGNTDLLAEPTYSMNETPFGLVKSSSTPPRTTFPDGPTAPASPMKAMGQVGPGKIFVKGETVRWDFVQVKNRFETAEGGNVLRYVEIKFDGDELTANQKRAQAQLKKQGKSDQLYILEEKDCYCDMEDNESRRETNKVIEQIGQSMRRAAGLFLPPGLGGSPLPIP